MINIPLKKKTKKKKTVEAESRRIPKLCYCLPLILFHSLWNGMLRWARLQGKIIYWLKEILQDSHC